jgi:hypothetical protein
MVMANEQEERGKRAGAKERLSYGEGVNKEGKREE